MAETTTTTTTAKPADNWADMEHDEEDEHEDIGLASKVPESTAPVKAEGEEEKKEEAQGEKPPQRKRKDYGDAYDPNYNKKKWRKGAAAGNNEEQKKNMAPAIAR
jgi:hypothetical protein